MHEFGLCEAIVQAIQRRAGGRPVARVRVRVGALQRVDDGAFKQSFAWAAADTEAAQASVDLVVIDARGFCRACKATVDMSDFTTICPSCGAAGVDILQGEEITLESIEYVE